MGPDGSQEQVRVGSIPSTVGTLMRSQVALFQEERASIYGLSIKRYFAYYSDRVRKG